MDTLNCIHGRRSVRRFLDVPVEFEKIGKIIDAGRMAPSAGNLQDWKFILITEKEQRDEVAKACLEQYWISQAPIIIVVCTDPERTKRFYDEQGVKFSTQNGAAAVMNMLLAIHDQELASCWVGAFEEESLKRALSIPDNVIVHAVLPIGYPDERMPTPVRMTMESVVFVGSWGNKIKDLAAYMEWYGEHVQKVIKKSKEFLKNLAKKAQE